MVIMFMISSSTALASIATTILALVVVVDAAVGDLSQLAFTPPTIAYGETRSARNDEGSVELALTNSNDVSDGRGWALRGDSNIYRGGPISTGFVPVEM